MIGILMLLLCAVHPVDGQRRLVDPKNARDCGCTLRKWPLLSEFLSRALPSIASLQPETLIPHYADAGCRGPAMPREGVYGDVRYSSLVGLDLFIDHDWHDLNFYVKLNGDAHYLNSETNEKNNNSFLCYNQSDRNCPNIKGETLMEVEWDTRHFPEKFWPTAGDQVWMLGRYAWDCGHPPDYHSEIHPPKAIASTRLEPYTFEGDSLPSLTNRTYIYIHGKSGVKNYSFKTVEGIESVVFNGYKDAPVANQDYEFDLPLPAKPLNYSGAPVAKVIELPFGGPAPVLTIDPAQKFVHVKYPLNLGDTSPDRKFAAVIVAGWRPPIPTVRFRKLTVRIEQIQVRKRHNAISLSDWNMWLNINGQWTKLEGLPAAESSLPLGIGKILNIEGILGTASPPAKINKTFQVIIPEVDGAFLTIQASGWVNVYDKLFGVREDFLRTALEGTTEVTQLLSQVSTSQGRIGLFFKQFSKANNFGIGPHNRKQEDYVGELSAGYEGINGDRESGFPQSYTETVGDFAISYTITEAP